VRGIADADKGKIVVALDLGRQSMVEQFTEAGYGTDLQYAEDDIPNQLAQIENMITKGVKVLVIAAIDGTTLSNALENARPRASRSSPMTG
jgi:ABC-type xylose transport system substrate-binding protein